MKNNLTETEIEQAETLGIRFFESEEEKSLAYLKEALARTDEERFLFLTHLMKMQLAMKKENPEMK